MKDFLKKYGLQMLSLILGGIGIFIDAKIDEKNSVAFESVKEEIKEEVIKELKGEK